MVATNVGPQKRDGALNRGAVNVLAVVAAVAVANGYYIQPLLNEVGREMALPHVLLGILPAATQIGLAIGLVLLMPLADAHARRVLLIVVPLQIAALLLVAASGNVWMLAAGCFAIGLFGITPYVLPPYASVRVSSGLLGRTTGVLTGGVICGILLARTVAGFIAVHSGWRSVYVLAAAAMACVLFFMARLIRRQASAPITTSYRRLLASLVHLVRSQPALRTAALCQAFSFGSFNVFWLGSTFYLHARFGWKPDAIGSVGIVGAVAALSAPLFGRATQRFGAQRTRFIALVAVVISWGMLAILRESLAGMAVALIILDVATTVGDISNRTIIYALAPEIRTRLNAVYTIAMFVGGGTMSLLVGLCWTLNAWSGLCLLGAASALVSLLLAQSSRGDLMRSRWQKRGLAPTNFYGAMMFGAVGYHDFEGLTVRDDEKARLVTSIGNKRALILRNHGLLAHGPTIPDAFNTLYRPQRACEVQAATSVIDEGLTIPEEICNDSYRNTFGSQLSTAHVLFDAMVHLIDKKDPSYKTQDRNTVPI